MLIGSDLANCRRYHKIMTADLVFPSYFSPEVADIISLFLKRDPKERLQDPHKIK